jgi:hypothetical protein
MSGNDGHADPIGTIDDAITAVVDGLGADDAEAVARWVRAGLDAMDTTAPDEWLAEFMIAPVAELEHAERIEWAQAFAVEPWVNRLNGDAWELVRALVEGTRPVEELAAEADARLNAIDLEDITFPARLMRKRNEAIADLRWVASRGMGPASLRAGRYRHKNA